MPEPTTPRVAPLVPIIVLSLTLGGLAGGLGGYFVARTSPTLTSDASVSTKTVKVEEDSATVDVVNKAIPAVVTIVATQDVPAVLQQPLSPFDNFFGLPFLNPQTQPNTNTEKQEVSRGSGFIISSDGMIVTNKHVVDNDKAEYTVILSDERKFTAKILAKDPSNDVALVKIEASDLPTLTLGDSDSVKIGQTVLAIGDPLSFTNTVTKGIISGKSRTITASDGSGQGETLEDIFQIDAAINPGNSGGPLLDLTGSVIAMNTAVSQEGQLIGFSLPIQVVKRDVDSFKTSGKIVQPYLGVRYVLVDEAYAKQHSLPVDYGALIQHGQNNDAAVMPDSPAAKAGLKENDIILEVDGKKINQNHSLAGLLSSHEPGDVVTLKIFHDKQEKEVNVTLAERPAS